MGMDGWEWEEWRLDVWTTVSRAENTELFRMSCTLPNVQKGTEENQLIALIQIPGEPLQVTNL